MSENNSNTDGTNSVEEIKYDLSVGQTVYLRCKVVRLGENCVVSVKPEGMDFPSAWFNVHRNCIIDPKFVKM